MNPTKFFGSLILTATLATATFAQSSSTSSGASLRGVQHVEASFGYSDIKGLSDNLYGANIAFNAPVAEGFDLGAELAYAWVETRFVTLETTTINAHATAFRDFNNIRGFATASLGYAWFNHGIDGEALWGVRLGTEFNLSERLTAIVSGGFDDAFDSATSGTFDGSLRFNYLASETVLPFVEISIIEGGSFAARAGLAWTF